MTSNNATGAPPAGTTPEIEELRERLVEARRQLDAEHNARASTYDQMVQLREQLLATQEALGAERAKIASLTDRFDRCRVRAWALVIFVCLVANVLPALR